MLKIGFESKEHFMFRWGHVCFV